MPAKIARSAPSAAVRGARITAAVRAARRSCQNAATAQKCTPVWGSSGESRLKPDDLPEDLKALALRHSLEIRQSSFSKDVDQLVELVKTYVGLSGEARVRTEWKIARKWEVIFSLVGIIAGLLLGWVILLGFLSTFGSRYTIILVSLVMVLGIVLGYAAKSNN